MRYLLSTADYELTLGTNDVLHKNNIHAYTDADFARDVSTRRSTTGSLVKVYNSSIAWTARRQSSVSTSTMEAEYIALNETAQDVMNIAHTIDELGIQNDMLNEPTLIRVDNQAAITIAEHPAHFARSKHIDTKWHKIRELVDNKFISLLYVSTKDQVADILTKSLPGPTFNRHRTSLGLAPASTAYIDDEL